jgi:hypothetical protein
MARKAQSAPKPSVITVIQQFNYDSDQHQETCRVEGPFELEPFGTPYVIESVRIEVRDGQSIVTIKLVEHGDPSLVIEPLPGLGLFTSQNIPADEPIQVVQ